MLVLAITRCVHWSVGSLVLTGSYLSVLFAIRVLDLSVLCLDLLNPTRVRRAP